MKKAYEHIQEITADTSSNFPFNAKITNILTDTTVRVRKAGSKTTTSAILSDEILKDIEEGRITLRRGMSVNLAAMNDKTYVTNILSQFDDEEVYIGKGISADMQAPHLRVEASTKGGFLLSWKPVKSASSYKVYKNDDPGGNSPVEVLQTKETSTYVPLSQTESGDDYNYFAVRAISGLFRGPLSQWMTTGDLSYLKLENDITDPTTSPVTIEIADTELGHLQNVFPNDLIRVTKLSEERADFWFKIDTVDDQSNHWECTATVEFAGDSAVTTIDKDDSEVMSYGQYEAGGVKASNVIDEARSVPYIDILTASKEDAATDKLTNQIRIGVLDGLEVSENATGQGIAIGSDLGSTDENSGAVIINESGVYMDNINLVIRDGDFRIYTTNEYDEDELRLGFDPDTSEFMILDWNDPGDSTLINGGAIQANSITATQIEGSSITAEELNFTPVDSDNIIGTINTSTEDGVVIDADKITLTGVVHVGGAADDINNGETKISGGQITAESIISDHISVDDLSAINADLGNMTAGTITGGTIQTDYPSEARVVMTGTTLRGYSDSSTIEWEAGTSNILSADGKLSIDKNTGIVIQSGGNYDRLRGYTFNDNGQHDAGGLYAQEQGDELKTNYIQIAAKASPNSANAWLVLKAEESSTPGENSLINIMQSSITIQPRNPDFTETYFQFRWDGSIRIYKNSSDKCYIWPSGNDLLYMNADNIIGTVQVNY